MVTKYVYTFSSINNLPLRTLHSILGLQQYTDPNDIIVFATPPIESTDIRPLERLGVDVRQVEPATDPFAAFDEYPKSYGEKTHLCDIDSDTVVFLDCDTLIYDDPEQLTQGDFDFKARPGTASEINESGWRNLFERYDKPVMSWMPNAGVLVFKNGIYQELKHEWRQYLSDQLGYSKGVNHKEQYALALAVSEYHTERMSPHEHVFEWDGERPTNGIVYHVGRTFDSRPRGIQETVKYLASEVKRLYF
jgi:hypothetical protein